MTLSVDESVLDPGLMKGPIDQEPPKCASTNALHSQDMRQPDLYELLVNRKAVRAERGFWHSEAEADGMP